MSAKRLLIVDDNPVNLKLVRVLLEGEGFDVMTATGAVEAHERIRERRPHLILMDIQMPGIDGLELTRQLKASAETRDIVIIALTAYAMRGDEEKALAAGCDGYVAKPINTRTLPQDVARWCAQKQAIHD